MFYILKVYLFILSLKYFTIIRLSHLIVLKYMKKAGRLPLINVIKEVLTTIWRIRYVYNIGRGRR